MAGERGMAGETPLGPQGKGRTAGPGGAGSGGGLAGTEPRRSPPAPPCLGGAAGRAAAFTAVPGGRSLSRGQKRD